MGSQGYRPKRSRMNWTIKMEQYFIKLTLEQIAIGNRFDGHSFTLVTWKEMSSSFSEKFEFDHDMTYVMKTHQRELRNRHKAIRNLLLQPGFIWNPDKNLVTADDDVWNEYVKLHPNAQTYRTRSIPYLNDLYTVFQEECIKEGDKILEEYETEQSKEVNESVDGSEKETNVCPKSEIEENIFPPRNRTNWNPAMVRFFIELMLAHVQQKGSVISKEAWEDMLVSFNDKFGSTYSVQILENRYTNLKRLYYLIKNLLRFDGFIWDETRQIVTADDHFWQEVIKVNEDARVLMTRPVPYYKDLSAIYEMTVNEKDSSKPKNVFEDGKSSGAFDQYVATSSFNVEDQMRKQELEKRYDYANSKRSEGDKGKASIVRETTTTNDENSFSLVNVIKAVQALPDMDEDLALDAFDFLEDENKAKAFMASTESNGSLGSFKCRRDVCK